MPLSQLPAFLSTCFYDLSAALDRRSAAYLFQLFTGALFAKGRRTVTSWFHAPRHAPAAAARSSPEPTPRPPRQRFEGEAEEAMGEGFGVSSGRPQGVVGATEVGGDGGGVEPRGDGCSG